MAQRARAVRRRKSGGGLYLVVGAFFAAVVALVATPFCLLFAAGMLPSGVAAMVDRQRQRYLTAAVSLLNLAGMGVPVLALLKAGPSLTSAFQVLGDGRNWLIMYSAAGVGWVLHAAMPIVGRVIVDYRAEREERRLTRHAQELVEEWGADVGRP